MDDMINLKKETLDVLNSYNKNVTDIEWVGSSDIEIPIDLFFEII